MTTATDTEPGKRGPGRPKRPTPHYVRNSSIMLYPEQIQAIDEIAESRNESRSHWARRVLEQAISQERESEEITEEAAGRVQAVPKN